MEYINKQDKLIELEADIQALYEFYIQTYRVYGKTSHRLFCLHLGGILGKTAKEVIADLEGDEIKKAAYITLPPKEEEYKPVGNFKPIY